MYSYQKRTIHTDKYTLHVYAFYGKVTTMGFIYSLCSYTHLLSFWYLSIASSSFQILSRGSVVSAGKITGTSFAIMITDKMAPNARIVVYYVRANGEIVTDSISFDVDGAFLNKVNIYKIHQYSRLAILCLSFYYVFVEGSNRVFLTKRHAKGNNIRRA